MTDLAGKAGLVTGGGAGIGQASAIALARSGARVGVLDRDLAAAEETAALIAEAGGTATAVAVDIAEESAVREGIAAVVRAFGGLDFAVNNAGIQSTGWELTEMALEEWERVLRVNLTGTFLCLRAELPELRERGGGAIVNVASNGGLGAIPKAPAYVASKHGVVGLTKVAAVDCAREGIRVNAVCPALTKTAMFETVTEGTELIVAQEAATPLGRLADPEEVAAAVVWLCSPESSYVTGTALSVDGGRRA